MHQTNVQFIDLPDEILLLILTKLDNTDVLYSLSSINNRRLDIIAQENIFTNTLNFVSISTSHTTDEIHSVSNSILDRFQANILPRIHQHIKSLTLTSDSMDCVFAAGIYPNLTELKIFNFNRTIVSHYFKDKVSMHLLVLEKIYRRKMLRNFFGSMTSVSSV